MPVKRRRSSASEGVDLPVSKKPRSRHPLDRLSDLSDELLIRILHHLPVRSLQDCQRLSHRFYTLAADSQIWKNLYYTRFVLPRALRIPGVRALLQDDDDDVLNYASRRSKWLDENTLVHRRDGKQTDWKGQYKLRHNWSIGACEVQEIHVADSPPAPAMLVRLAEGVVVTADRDEGLRAWDLKEKVLIASCPLDQDIVPTCLAVDEQVSTGLSIAVGFMNGGWGTWRLDVQAKAFTVVHMHPASSNGTLSAIAFAQPYVLTITDAQLLSLYTCDPKITIFDVENTMEDESAALNTEIPEESKDGAVEIDEQTSGVESVTQQPHLLASLKSHTSWPPLSLSIRTTPNTLIASIAYSLPTYLSGYTVGLQELHLSLHTGLITFSRLASALPQGFSSLSPSSSPTSSSPARMSRGRVSTRPTSLSYSHPYILATHPDNTLTLFLCMSDANNLSISSGTKLWGHTSSVSAAEITPRGKAVSVSTRGNELRVWELEGGLSSPSSASRKRVAPSRSRLTDRSVRVQVEGKEGTENEGNESAYEAKKQWVGFNDELVIVLKESEKGAAALVVYDFT